LWFEKIKSIAELVALASSWGPTKTVMCQGTFDIVHIGHLRHLLYAKAEGDILIVSLYTDSWLARHPCEKKLNQAQLQQLHVPQDQRTLAIAVIEAVDYVCPENEGSDNLLALKPNVFAIGYDYIYKKVDIEPQKKIVESYGGKMLFTPQN